MVNVLGQATLTKHSFSLTFVKLQEQRQHRKLLFILQNNSEVVAGADVEETVASGSYAPANSTFCALSAIDLTSNSFCLWNGRFSP